MTLNRHHGADSQFPERETLDSFPANVLSHEVCVHRGCTVSVRRHRGTRDTYRTRFRLELGAWGPRPQERGNRSVLGLSYQNRLQ